ncbi:peptidoglycan D,D-transpeptidase FtsI family protein [Priestia megaterium]|jgi:penicillin-binding protein 4B|uniref:peptidoglycan D,D-transpeptidase FtsI family protein n=1 Tax=Priestia megaterium TaxID=1404 RepID=UPI0006F4A416|nr:penicillin-binding transpeptidase domain-containing protein [Priestia megaterium]KQU14505.1 penicillin-binding protein [Bacillus sp. Leaf75]MED4756851.1 penicillin-binding transpeptidase domain-containing protein [Priestia megaterium]
MKIIHKRIYITLIFILLLISGLGARLVQLQLVSTESFTDKKINLIEGSVKQRTQEMVVDDGRGKFEDKNGQSLTSITHNRLVLFPFLEKMKWPVQQVSEIVGMQPKELTNRLANAKTPVVITKELSHAQVEKINALKVPGVFGIPLKDERPVPLAEHLIGLEAQSKQIIEEKYSDKLKNGAIKSTTPVGISGMQRAFDEFLLPEQESKLLYHVDRLGGPMFGIDVKYTGTANPYYPVSVRTTLDLSAQELVENTLNHYKLKDGGAVLIDIKNNKVIAMASRPSINKKDPFKKQNGSDSVENRLLTPQTPGSIFKTVTAAAALEQNKIQPSLTYNCDKNIYGNNVEEDHQKGQLTFEESFAQSCNATFAQLAKEMIISNPNILEQYADKLGLIQPVGWTGDVFHFEHFKQFLGEKSGRVWTNTREKKVPNAVAQTAIGQLDVKVTPLAVANMMATIARGGEKKQVKAVDALEYKNNTSLYTFKEHELKGDTINKATAASMQQLLKGVVQSEKGTGRRFQTLPYEVAGKSGTAEISVKDDIVNKWFAGYFPADDPKYAMVVVDLNTKSAISPTNSVFYDIVKGMYDLNTR